MTNPDEQKLTYCCEWDRIKYKKQAPTPSTPFNDDMKRICTRNKQYNSIGKRFGQYKRKKS